MEGGFRWILGLADAGCSLDYLFQLAVEMKKLGLPWISEVTRVGPDRA